MQARCVSIALPSMLLKIAKVKRSAQPVKSTITLFCMILQEQVKLPVSRWKFLQLLFQLITPMVSSPCVNVVSFNTTLLGTAVVAVEASNGQKSYTRALIDPRAEFSFAAECLVQNLRLQLTPLRISIAGVDSVQSTTGGITLLIISSRINTQMSYQVNLYILI